jgi:ribosomal protein L13
MLPTEKSRGREAFKLLKVYIAVPDNLASSQKETLQEIQSSRLRGRFIALGEVAKTIGWNP